jgi:hypothetical protein
METPNQPVGDSTRILQFLNTRFPARAGHWGGWEIETYPVISSIRFLDAERTHAAVRVTVGYSGATVVMRKVNGQWTAIEMVDHWVT